ncbi:MAG: TonB family protein [Cyclobacteriaceae bacterium]
MIKASENNAHLSTSQISGYINDDLKPSERHQIERHILDCELCAEALEGFELHGISREQITSDIHSLNERLTERVASGASKNNRWAIYGIAASLTLVLVSVIWIFQSDLLTSEQSVADNKPTEVFMEKNESAVADTLIALDSSPVETNMEPQDEAIIEPDVSDPSNKVLESEEELVINDFDEAMDEPEIAALEEGPQELIADDMGADDDIATNSTAGEGVAAQQPTAVLEVSPDQSKQLEEKLQSEAFQAAKKQALQSRSARLLQKDSSPSPPVPMNEYLENLQSNLQYPNEAERESIEGEVEVKFIVNEDGSLSDFEVVKPLGFGCDEEAIRVLRQGPKWTPAATATSQNIIIKFSLP